MGMDKIIVKGGKKLKGDVRISGAKNSTLPLMAASLLCPEEVRLSGVPSLRDIETMKRLLMGLGIQITGPENGRMVLKAEKISNTEASYELVRTMRASFLILGPLLARMKKARVSLPGGCAIGARPIDLHLKGLAALGAGIELKDGYIEAEASRLSGANISLDVTTVTGTENLIMAACLAKGRTLIENAAREPEVVELATVLNSMGARVSGMGSDKIVIEGVEKLRGTDHSIMPDRIETGTYMIASAITGGNIRILNGNPGHLDAVISKLKEAGTKIECADGIINVKGPAKPGAVDVRTSPYPGFPTDLQAQFMSLMCVSNGRSIISETVFENRFIHVGELKRMGADIRIEGNTAVVKGVEELLGAPVMATDLRASACLILAGLAAEGSTEVSRVYHLDRGYERIVEKLKGLGADIERTKE